MDLAIKTCGNGLTYGPCGFFFFNIAILYYFVVKDSKTKARKKKINPKKKIYN